MIRTDDVDMARRFEAVTADPANSITYCCCSIFDDCWLLDTRHGTQEPEPR